MAKATLVNSIYPLAEANSNEVKKTKYRIHCRLIYETDIMIKRKALAKIQREVLNAISLSTKTAFRLIQII